MADGRQFLLISLEIEPDTDPIAGVIRTSDGRSMPFTGWLALSAGVEKVRRAAGQLEPELITLGYSRLTRTEHEVVSLLCEGLTNPEIARRLTVSARTVQGHLLKVFRKLGVSSRTELVARMLRAEMWSATEEGTDP